MKICGFCACPAVTRALSERKSTRMSGRVGHLMLWIVGASVGSLAKVTTCSRESWPTKARQCPDCDQAQSFSHARVVSNSVITSPASGSAPNCVVADAIAGAASGLAPSRSSRCAEMTRQR
jgi:hypothetical protein